MVCWGKTLREINFLQFDYTTLSETCLIGLKSLSIKIYICVYKEQMKKNL